MRVKVKLTKGKAYGAGHGNMKVNLNDGTELYCAKGSIRLTVPKKLTGKVGGMAGMGVKGKDWIAGPNMAQIHGSFKAKVKPGKLIPGLPGCPQRYQYPIRGSPYNGNAETKPIVQWFRSWQGDGDKIPEAFGYLGNKNSKWFNEVDRSNPPKGGNANRPSGKKKKAMHKCRAVKKKKKAFQKCVFDYLVLGKDGRKVTVQDARGKKRVKGAKPDPQSVR